MGIDGMELLSVALIAPTEWPWESMEMFVEYALCDAGTPSQNGEGYDVLPLSCSKPKAGPEAYALTLETRVPELATEFANLADASGLQLSFAGTQPLGPFGGIRHLTLRSPDGDLILLASAHPFAVADQELPIVDDPLWGAPFSEFSLAPQGCEYRESVRPGSELEEPLAIQFDADEGIVAVFDREVGSVVAGGSSFGMFVFNAFRRNETSCDDCGEAEASFLILRSPR